MDLITDLSLLFKKLSSSDHNGCVTQYLSQPRWPKSKTGCHKQQAQTR